MKLDLVETVARPATKTHRAGPPASPPRLGDVLRMHNLITAQQLEDALTEGKRLGIRIGQALIGMNVLNQDQINWALARHLDIPYLMLTNDMIDAELVRSLPEEPQRRLGFVPLLALENELTIVMSDPTDQRALDRVRQLAGSPYKVAIAQSAAIEAALDAVFGPRGSTAQAPGLDRHLATALEQGADELHFHPQEGDVVVTWLHDGEALRQTRETRGAYAAILAEIDGQSQHQAASGRRTGFFRCALEGEERRIPFVLLPTVGEPSLLLNIPRAVPASRLSGLGLASDTVDRIGLLLGRRRGLVVVAGLKVRDTIRHLYALLGEIAPRAGECIVAVERMCETRFPAAFQISFEQLPEPSYETALAAAHACRPSILLVDSITDLGPEALARLLRTAVGGALVLVGVEAGDTTEALSLVGGLCPSPSLISSSLLFVLAHAPVRRVCPHCKTSAGCPRCNNTGYSEPIRIHALLEGACVESIASGRVPVEPGAVRAGSTVATTLQARVQELVLRGEMLAGGIR